MWQHTLTMPVLPDEPNLSKPVSLILESCAIESVLIHVVSYHVLKSHTMRLQ